MTTPPARKVLLIAGARPNFMKIAPLVRAFAARADAFDARIVHTGQHYDPEMSDVFFDELGIPQPHFRLDVGSGTHAQQTARVMTAFEGVCVAERPDLVLVVGDVNSTIACALVAKKLGVEVAHVEAGLRSGDRRMPEEINRLATDAISDWFFVTEPAAVENLRREGQPEERIHFVGHVMIDNLFYQLEKLRSGPSIDALAPLRQRLGARYGVVTLHRPSNVDDWSVLQRILGALERVSHELPLFFAVHPRTAQRLKDQAFALSDRIVVTGPQPFMSFLSLWSKAAFVMTDSGGLQEESTALGVPCITIRENTERPITLTEGTNELVGTDAEKIVEAGLRAAAGRWRAGARPQFWDGRAAERIVTVLESGHRSTK
jgi:UDP-N-acetylglucosamine 2-epimerase (non-hydrolysing)